MTIKRAVIKVCEEMMKCFTIFKDKSSKSRGGRSAPELRNTTKSDNSAAASRPTRSTGSTTDAAAATTSLPRSIPEMYREKEQNLTVFSLSELREATNNFNRMLKLGEGGFGSVYKGKIRLPNGQGDQIPVAIKKLNTAGLQVLPSSSSSSSFILFIFYGQEFHLLDNKNLRKKLNFAQYDCINRKRVLL